MPKRKFPFLQPLTGQVHLAASFSLSALICTFLLQVAMAQDAEPTPPDGAKPSEENNDVIGDPPEYVDDPYDEGSGAKVQLELVDLYKEYEKKSDYDFERSHDEIHQERRAATKTSGYRDLQDRKKQLEKWRKAFEVGFDDSLKAVKESSEAFRKALDRSEKPQGATGTDPEADTIKRALQGELGPVDPRSKRLLEKARHLRTWMIRLRDAEKHLKEGLEALEETSEPYAKAKTVPSSLNGRWRISSKFPQDGSTVNCTETDNSFVCVFDEPSAKAQQQLGLQKGDLSMEGKLSQLTLSGVKYHAFKPGPGDNCPNMNGNLAYEMRNATISSDGNRISGERKFPVYAKSSCRTISDLEIWLPFEYIRVQ